MHIKEDDETVTDSVPVLSETVTIKDSCIPNPCGDNANCQPRPGNKRVPICECKSGYDGDPYTHCNKTSQRQPKSWIPMGTDHRTTVPWYHTTTPIPRPPPINQGILHDPYKSPLARHVVSRKKPKVRKNWVSSLTSFLQRSKKVQV